VIEMSLGVGLGLLFLARENLTLASLRADSQAVLTARVPRGNGVEAV
jgi:hypothetical protein